MKLKRPLLDDLMIGPSDECWSWEGKKPYPNGYVYFSLGRRHNEIGGHRLVAELIYGDVTGKHVHHTCGNRACANPAHLEVLTPSEHQRLHGRERKCEHGDEFRRTKKSGRTYCASCQSERYRLWYYEGGGRQWHQRRNKVEA